MVPQIESMSFEEFSRKEALKRLLEDVERLETEEKEKLKEKLKEEPEKLKQFLELK